MTWQPDGWTTADHVAEAQWRMEHDRIERELHAAQDRAWDARGEEEQAWLDEAARLSRVLAAHDHERPTVAA